MSLEEHKLNVKEREVGRQKQCFYRTGKGTCARVDTLLGWTQVMPIEDCDKCWDLGGAYTPDGEKYCWEIVNRSSDLWKDPKNIRRAPREVLIALTVHHLDPEERKTLVQSKDFQMQIVKGYLWSKVRHSWQPDTISAFFKAKGSKILFGKVDPLVKQTRWRSCSGLDPSGRRMRPECAFFKTTRDGQHHFCGACGCGEKEDTILDRDDGGYSKLDYPYLECPLEEEGFSNERQPE